MIKKYSSFLQPVNTGTFPVLKTQAKFSLGKLRSKNHILEIFSFGFNLEQAESILYGLSKNMRQMITENRGLARRLLKR